MSQIEVISSKELDMVDKAMSNILGDQFVDMSIKHQGGHSGYKITDYDEDFIWINTDYGVEGNSHVIDEYIFDRETFELTKNE